MTFYIPDHIMRWAGPAVICTIGGIVIFGSPVTQEMLCSETQNCLATWVSALSGWVAAGAAALTIGSLFKQANAQQKQTDFQLGDASPTIDAVQHFRTGSLLIMHIVNWNRRGFILREIKPLTGNHKIAVKSVELDEAPEQLEADEEGFHPFPITGWLDRSGSPHILKVRFKVTDGLGSEIDDNWAGLVLSVKYELVGESEQKQQIVKVHMTSATSAEQ